VEEMNLDDFRLYLGQICHDMQRIAINKNKDYSIATKTHQNFEEMAELCKIFKVDVTTPEGCIEFQIIWKIRRLFKLKREGRKPTNESLQNNVVDANVYIALLAGYDE